MGDTILSNFDGSLTVAVVGASGGLGRAFVQHLSTQSNVAKVHAFSRSKQVFDAPNVQSHYIDITSEESIKNALKNLEVGTLFDVVIVATGFLHSDNTSPEKTIRDVSLENFHDVFSVNTFGPALIAKHFLPLLPRNRRSVFACLSARVGSISDNQLGGWYAYRASKTALNMILKNAAIETARRYKDACVVGLHPGTVDTALSEPFQRNVQEGKLFTPQYSVEKLLQVINDVQSEQSGLVFAWDGQEVPA